MTGTRYLGSGLDIGGTIITNSGSPSGSTDLANKSYVDNLVNGLEYKKEVAGASTANLTLSTGFVAGVVIDGYTLVLADRYLIKNQTTQTDNGIYVITAGAPTRASDASTSANLNNATVYVTHGTVNKGLSFTQTTVDPTVGSSNIVFAQISSGTTYTGSTGVTLSGTDFQLASTAAGAGLGFTSGVLAVTNTDTSVTVGADTVSVALKSGSGVTGPGLAVSSGLTVDSSVARIFRTSSHASTTSIAITHGIGNQHVISSVDVTSTGEVVECDIVNTSTTVTTFTFGSAPTLNTLTFTITG